MNLGPGTPDPVLFLLGHPSSHQGPGSPCLVAELRPEALITAERVKTDQQSHLLGSVQTVWWRRKPSCSLALVIRLRADRHDSACDRRVAGEPCVQNPTGTQHLLKGIRPPRASTAFHDLHPHVSNAAGVLGPSPGRWAAASWPWPALELVTWVWGSQSQSPALSPSAS